MYKCLLQGKLYQDIVIVQKVIFELIQQIKMTIKISKHTYWFQTDILVILL